MSKYASVTVTVSKKTFYCLKLLFLKSIHTLSSIVKVYNSTQCLLSFLRNSKQIFKIVYDTPNKRLNYLTFVNAWELGYCLGLAISSLCTHLLFVWNFQKTLLCVLVKLRNTVVMKHLLFGHMVLSLSCLLYPKRLSRFALSNLAFVLSL